MLALWARPFPAQAMAFNERKVVASLLWVTDYTLDDVSLASFSLKRI